LNAVAVDGEGGRTGRGPAGAGAIDGNCPRNSQAELRLLDDAVGNNGTYKTSVWWKRMFYQAGIKIKAEDNFSGTTFKY